MTKNDFYCADSQPYKSTCVILIIKENKAY